MIISNTPTDSSLLIVMLISSWKKRTCSTINNSFPFSFNHFFKLHLSVSLLLSYVLISSLFQMPPPLQPAPPVHRWAWRRTTSTRTTCWSPGNPQTPSMRRPSPDTLWIGQFLFIAALARWSEYSHIALKLMPRKPLEVTLYQVFASQICFLFHLIGRRQTFNAAFTQKH